MLNVFQVAKLACPSPVLQLSGYVLRFPIYICIDRHLLITRLYLNTVTDFPSEET